MSFCDHGGGDGECPYCGEKMPSRVATLTRERDEACEARSRAMAELHRAGRLGGALATRLDEAMDSDLARVSRERDEARAEVAAWEASHSRERAQLDAMTERAGALAGDLNAAREALASTKRERDQSRAELALAYEREMRWYKASVDAHTEVARWMRIAKAAEAALLRALGRPVEIGLGAPTSGPCAHREWTAEDEERDAPFPSGPPCGKRATHTSCVPTIGALTCDEHKCRCARPLPATETK